MKRAILDTNLLILLVTGLAEPAYNASHKRLSAYDVDDFTLLTGVLQDFSCLIVTPNILSETSNLLRNFSEPGRSRLGAMLRGLIDRCDERYLASKVACGHGHYLRLGLADAATLAAQEQDDVLLTDDLDLYIASVTAGNAAINFAHLRDR